MRKKISAALGLSLNLLGKNLLLPFLLLAFSGNVWAQQSITTLGTAITQNFNGMGNATSASLPTGFKISNNATPTWANASTTTTSAAAGTSGTGVLSSGSIYGIYNLAQGVTASSTDRALGFVTSSNSSAYSPWSIVYAFTNNTGSTVTSLDISFDYEKYRSGSRAWDWFFYHSSAANSAGTNLNDGNQTYTADADNNVVYNPPASISKTFTISGLTITNGSTYYLIWRYTGNGGKTNSQILGLDNFSIKLNTTPTDTTPPSLSSLNPTNSATNVLVGSNLVATFDENVAKGTGNIIIKRYSDNSVVETIDVTSSQVTVSGATVTIDPTANLASNTHYYLEIASTAIKDLANNNFAGISGNAAWNFTTEVLSPNINLSTTTLSGFNYLEGFGPSAEQMFTISGQNLTGNVILDAPANYEISKSTGTGFGASISFTPAELASAQNVYVHLKSGLSASSSPYNSENIAISGGGITTQNVVCNGTVTANTMVDFGNLQWPSTLSVDEGDTSATVYARTYKAGVTTADGNQSQITVWIGVSPQNAAANSDPSTWTTWIPASFDSRQNDGYGNLHHYQYSTTINTASLGLTPGTYRYASRFQMGTGSFYYGGFSSGQWDGSTNTSGTLTINSNLVDGGQVTLNPTSPAEGTASVATLEIYEAGLTDTPTQNTNVTIEFAYKAASDSNPNSWSVWSSAGLSFTNAGNNDKYSFTLPSNLTPGNYYVAARAKKTGSTEWQYFGKDWSTWASSAVLTVTSNVVSYANVQHPFSETIVQGNGVDVYTRVYKADYTNTTIGGNANINSWIGYSTTNATAESDFATVAWTWVPATFNGDFGNDDEYVANIGSSLSAGTYYYVSRYQVTGSTEYKYGGTNNNFWTESANSGVLTVQTPREINVKQTTDIASGGTYTFANQISGTSSSAITFTVENTGQESLSVGALSISGTNADQFTITQVDATLPHSVAGGTNTTFTVTFSPTSAGSKTAQLSLANNDANESPYIINLTGLGGPANDNCSGAAIVGTSLLTVNAAATAGTLVGSTPQSGFTQNDVWYSFTPSCTGQLTLTLNGFTGADLGFSVFATSCPTSNTGYVVDQDSGYSGTAETNTFTYTGGTTYYIRVWKFGGNDTTFNIRITSPNLGTPSTISANPTTFCEGATVTFTATAVTNATSYTWTVPSGWAITGYPTINTMTATVGATAGAVTAKAVNCYGEGIQKSQSFTPGLVPATPGSITGSSAVCEGTSNTYSVAAVSGATSYTWTLPSGWFGTSTTNSITTVASSTAGTISVTANSSSCGSSSPQTLSVSVTARPTATAATDITDTSFTANWNTVVGATGYELDVYKKESTAAPEFVTNGSFETGSLTGWTFAANLNQTVSTSQKHSGTHSLYISSSHSTGNREVSQSVSGLEIGKQYKMSVWYYSDTSSSNDAFRVWSSNPTIQLPSTSGYYGSVKSSWQNIESTFTATATSHTFVLRFYSGARIYLDDISIRAVDNVETKTYVSGYNPKTITGGSTTSDVVTGLTADTQYHYVVRTITSTCESSNSNEIDVKTDNTVVWDAGAWSNTTGPGNSGTLDVIVRAPFVVGANIDQASFTAKNLTVESTGSLEIPANESITVAGNIITADNKITIDSDGSLLQTNAPSTNQNTGKIIVKRSTHMRKMDYTYWGTPVTGQPLLNTSNSTGGTNPALYNLGGFSEGTPNNRIYQYNEPNDTFKAATDTDFVPAKAYAIRGKDSYAISNPSNNPIADEFSFTGIANNGAYTVGIQKSKNTPSSDPVKPYTHGYNMIGNPYPSSIDFIKFYNLNHGDGTKNSDHILGKAWFWSNVSVAPTNQGGSGYTPNNYAILSLAGTAPATGIDNGETSGNPAPNQFIKVAQGFIVEMKGTPPTGTDPALTATLKFDNSIRENNNTGYFYNSKTVENINRYWLKLTSPFNIVNTILVAHMDNATNNYDEDYDAELLSVGDDSFYSKLNSQKLQIQARNNPLNIEDVISLGAKYSTEGTYKISLGIKEGLFSAGQQIYLLDKVTNTYTDLTTQDYTFSAVKGTDEARFEIVYKNKEVLGTDTISKSDFIVYKDADHFVIKSSQILGKVELYDASGRLVVSKNSNEKQIRIDSSALSSGVYIIKADNSGNIRTKKLLK